MPAPAIRNVSPLGLLIVPALGRDVDAGAEVVVDDIALAASLLAQPDVWAPANAEAEALLPAPPAPAAPADSADTDQTTLED